MSDTETLLKTSGSANECVEWRISTQLTDYSDAVTQMEQQVEAIRAGKSAECIWLLEHPPTYTAGTSASADDLLLPDRFPVHTTGRGGQYTYHGPGQRIAYVMLDLNRRGKDVRAFVCSLENWVMDVLSQFDIIGERRQGRVGVWVQRPGSGTGREDKIAAIGVRVRRWVTFHGIALNVHPDLEHYSGIVPCGVSDHGVTSFKELGKPVLMNEIDLALHRSFDTHFVSPE